jgi:hypothetical protein
MIVTVMMRVIVMMIVMMIVIVIVMVIVMVVRVIVMMIVMMVMFSTTQQARGLRAVMILCNANARWRNTVQCSTVQYRTV